MIQLEEFLFRYKIPINKIQTTNNNKFPNFKGILTLAKVSNLRKAVWVWNSSKGSKPLEELFSPLPTLDEPEPKRPWTANYAN